MLRMDTPALEKGGYTLGLAPIAFQYKGSARVLVIRPFDGSAEKKDHSRGPRPKQGSSPSLTLRAVYPPFSRAGDQPPGWWWVSSRKAASPFRSICPWQMVSFGRGQPTKNKGVLHLLCSTPCFHPLILLP